MVKLPCTHLAVELDANGINTVDYMTIDTEGSELDIIRDFPWARFTVRVVQIEVLDEGRFPGKVAGNEQQIVQTMSQHGYKLHLRFQVAARETYDLMFVPTTT